MSQDEKEDLVAKLRSWPKGVGLPNLVGAKLVDADLSGADLTAAKLTTADLSHANLSSAKLTGANLAYADLSSANLSGAYLSGANLNGADLSGAYLNGADLSGANLTGVLVRRTTRFEGAEVLGTTIERHVLEQLDDDYGGLKRADRLRMNIRDDVATLRGEFSGFMQWLHAGGILAFIAPYIAFTVSKSVMVYPFDCSEGVVCEPLLSGLWRYAWTHQPIYEKLIFLFWIAYNSARGTLLFKTKKLEMQETARQLPVLFSFSEAKWWDRTYKFVHWGFWVHAVAVVAHLAQYMMTPVPK